MEINNILSLRGIDIPPSNHEIANILEMLAFFSEMEGENPHKILAYRRAARQIKGMEFSLAEAVEKGEKLTKYPSIGKAIEKKIIEIVKFGTLEKLEILKKKYPPELMELSKVPGIGPKKLKQLYIDHKVQSPRELWEILKGKKNKKLPGLGPAMEKRILSYLEKYLQEEKEYNFPEAEEVAHQICNLITSWEKDIEVNVVGSVRRRKERVSDIDILITSHSREILKKVLKRLQPPSNKSFPDNTTRVEINHSLGIKLDIRIVPPYRLGQNKIIYTGNRGFVQSLVKKIPGAKIDKMDFNTEEEVFESLNLPFIPPELREGEMSVDRIMREGIPSLIEISHIRGDLHMHTTWTDGRNSIEEMALEARKRGYEYIGITDHSKRMRMVGGLDENRLLKQIKEIERLNSRLGDIYILKGIEVDILEDGNLDLSLEILQRLDYVIASIHSNFSLPSSVQTKRIIKALSLGVISILGHPTARLLGKRPPMDIDIEEIFLVAREIGCVMELNSQPDRLDLKDTHLQRARDMGIKIAINSDAHHYQGLGVIRFGINQARRGWLEPGDVINTLSLEKLMSIFKKR